MTSVFLELIRRTLQKGRSLAPAVEQASMLQTYGFILGCSKKMDQCLLRCAKIVKREKVTPN